MNSDAVQVNDGAVCYLVGVDAHMPPAGYRSTEVGVIPHDWTVGTLGDTISALQAGVSVKSTAEDFVNGVPAILKTSCIESGSFFPDEAKPIAPKDRKRATLNPRRSAILISRMNTIDLVGECGFVDQDYPELFIPDRLWMTHLRSSTGVSPRWLTYVLSSAPYRRQLQTIASGTSDSMNIAKGSLLGLQVAYPPPPEQHAIAEALSDVDRLLGTLEALLAKKRAIKQAAMQQLLTGKTRLPGFDDDWKRATVGAEFHIELGKMLDAEKNVGVPKPFLGNQAVQWGFIDTRELGTIKLTPSDLHRYRLEHGDLLVCEGGEIGRAAIWTGELSECYYQKALHRLRPKKDYDPRLMLYLFRHFSATGALLNYATQTSIAHLPKEKIETIPIVRPSSSEQAAIATVLSDMDAEIAALEARRDKTRAIKQGMMQQLLTGRVRLLKPTSANASA